MKIIFLLVTAVFLGAGNIIAQDSLFLMKSGKIVYRRAVADIDSILISKPNSEGEYLYDIDGNRYRKAWFGSQLWMIDNLKTTRYNDGGLIPFVSNYAEWSFLISPAYYITERGDDINHYYGALYNWYSVNTGKLCPDGWNVPTDDDWTTFENYLIANGYNYDGTKTGNKIAQSLAASYNNMWEFPDTIPLEHSYYIGTPGFDHAKNNKSRFWGWAGTCRWDDGGVLLQINQEANWWTATGFDNKNAWFRQLRYNQVDLVRENYNKRYGFSVRCVKY